MNQSTNLSSSKIRVYGRGAIKINPARLTPSGHRGHAHGSGEAKECAMEFGIFNLMGSRDPKSR
jgi:hypothetical protein